MRGTRRGSSGPARTAVWVAVAATWALAGAACGDDDDSAGPDTATTESTRAAVPEEAEWGYEGEIGPDRWGELSPDYTACADGSAQSPIDLAGATERDIADIGFDYAESDLNIFNNGHTIEVEYDAGSSIDLESGPFDVVQFHFHAGSEHTVDGRQYPMELHVVHQDPEERLAVVGLFVDVGAENEPLADVFASIPTEPAEEASTVPEASVDLAEVLPESQTYFQYEGSLTTPPCTEGVSWQVLDTPIEISQGQLDAFTAVVDGNFRPPQTLGDRELVHDSAADA